MVSVDLDEARRNREMVAQMQAQEKAAQEKAARDRDRRRTPPVRVREAGTPPIDEVPRLKLGRSPQEMVDRRNAYLEAHKDEIIADYNSLDLLELYEKWAFSSGTWMKLKKAWSVVPKGRKTSNRYKGGIARFEPHLEEILHDYTVMTVRDLERKWSMGRGYFYYLRKKLKARGVKMPISFADTKSGDKSGLKVDQDVDLAGHQRIQGEQPSKIEQAIATLVAADVDFQEFFDHLMGILGKYLKEDPPGTVKTLIADGDSFGPKDLIQGAMEISLRIALDKSGEFEYLGNDRYRLKNEQLSEPPAEEAGEVKGEA